MDAPLYSFREYLLLLPAASCLSTHGHRCKNGLPSTPLHPKRCVPSQPDFTPQPSASAAAGVVLGIAAAPDRWLRFIMHGYAKLARGPESFIHILDARSVPMPFLMAWSAILVELVCCALMLAELFIPLISAPMVIVLLVAIFTVHLPNGLSSIKLESVTSAGAHFGSPATKRTCFIEPPSSRWCWADRGRSRSAG